LLQAADYHASAKTKVPGVARDDNYLVITTDFQ